MRHFTISDQALELLTSISHSPHIFFTLSAFRISDPASACRPILTHRLQCSSLPRTPQHVLVLFSKRARRFIESPFHQYCAISKGPDEKSKLYRVLYSFLVMIQYNILQPFKTPSFEANLQSRSFQNATLPRCYRIPFLPLLKRIKFIPGATSELHDQQHKSCCKSCFNTNSNDRFHTPRPATRFSGYYTSSGN